MNAKELSYRARQRYFARHDNNVPTLDEIREATANSIADTIKQILNGQAVYYGYDCEPDNSIPAIRNSSDYDKIDRTAAESYQKRYAKVRAERIKQSLDEQINELFGNSLTAEQIAEKKKALGLD